MSQPKSKVSNLKHEWKRQVNNISIQAKRLQNKAKAGDIIRIGEAYSIAHDVYRLGMRGIELSHKAAELDMSPRVTLDIGINCHELEEHSLRLMQLLQNRDLLLRHYPLFVSTLEYTCLEPAEEIDPVKDLERIMRGN